MFARALTAFLILPGLAAVITPPIIGFLDPWRVNHLLPGGQLAWAIPVMTIGSVILLWCVRDFYVGGKGTLAPWDPPKSLVIVGLYRIMRNPMYIGVLILVVGWALLYGSPLLFIYTVCLGMAFHLRVVLFEEPWLDRQFESAWRQYSNEVPRWLPGLQTSKYRDR